MDKRKEQKLQKVRYEFYSYEASSSAPLQTTLVLSNPASVRFIGTDSNLGNSRTIINNQFVLQAQIDFLNGTAIYPYELILVNSVDEVDETVYTILMKPNSQLKVVCKYFVNE